MYDYIVVGAGSAGCVLAARLSEDENVSVLLIEAGPPDTLENIHIPLGVTALARSAVDWDMWTGHEPHCDGRRVYLPRGKTLGGSSSTNAMVYIRGNAADYDAWRDAGCDGWGYEDLLPYFKRSEDNERGESYYHGVGGPLGVSEGRHPNPMMDAVVAAGISAGLPANEDFNAAAQDGMGRYQVTQRDGRRCSTSVAYLHPVMERPNLTVECGVHVERVVFDGLRAVGVAGTRVGQPLMFDCTGEVIVAGGAYSSPQILMLSGIGPAEHLGSRLIPPIADRPMVGRNLQDHVQLWLEWRSDDPVGLATAMTPENVEANLTEFMTSGTGPFTSNIAEVGGFARSGDGQPAPDLQIHAIPGMLSEDPPFGIAEPGISIGVCLLTPKSRGEVYLWTAEPTAKPHIMHRYFAEDDDMERMETGLGLLMEIARQPALAPYCSAGEQLPASGSAADLRAFVRRHAQTLYHPVGTCAMGPDDGAVVDLELRVRGVDGLRVVDASVIPTIPRGNTNAPTIAIAERAADLIRGFRPLAPEARIEAPAA
ncbi:MAG TPA: GMC family oxidoreductase N-terminal domain-containing protein [Thermoleophilaceae bacterium]|nr:GMC family oxidoreductase N-terminal domain-containing protein [Thermoleophilaceae bacterium]